jgi:hypothetical protein
VQTITVYSGTVAATGDLATFAVGLAKSGTCLLKTTAVSGSSPTLDVYLQTVLNGVDDDYCRFNQVTGVANQLLRFSTTTGTAASAVVVPSDRAAGIAAGACRAGAPGSLLKVAAVLGGTATPTVTMTLTCTVGGG